MMRSPVTATGQWLDALPLQVRNCILWYADHEAGTLDEWRAGGGAGAGGGIFNTGQSEVEAGVSHSVAHSGQYSARVTITNAYRARNGSRAVRLMRWADQHGRHFPSKAYYSVWAYWPRAYNPNKYPPWDLGDGGWWNVFQFKVKDRQGVSQPMWVLNVRRDEFKNEMVFYLYSKYNPSASLAWSDPVAIPVGKWVHIEAAYQISTQHKGRIAIWQDAQLLFDIRGVRTALWSGHAYAIWGVGNYTDHISGDMKGGTATIFFDDAAVSTMRLLSQSSRRECQ
ncbi:MAG: polysaccharide lyase [Candidatus Tectomicrobia bacterium]|nr:polysaccharide lyase [Candidatus Tectomicrobia bacterium]